MRSCKCSWEGQRIRNMESCSCSWEDQRRRNMRSCSCGRSSGSVRVSNPLVCVKCGEEPQPLKKVSLDPQRG